MKTKNFFWVKSLIGLLLLSSISACGTARWESLPVSIYIENNILNKSAISAIETYNKSKLFSKVDNVFIISKNKEEASIKIFCGDPTEKCSGIKDKIGGCAHIPFFADNFVRAEIIINCDKLYSGKATKINLVGHELFHILGFLEHSANPECLNFDPYPRKKSMKSYFCEEMQIQMREKYPELFN